jgi:chromosome segregation ATPase
MDRDTDLPHESDNAPSHKAPWHLLRTVSGGEDSDYDRSVDGASRYAETYDLARQASARLKAMQSRVEEIEEKAREAVRRTHLELEEAEARAEELARRLEDAEQRAAGAEARANDAEQWLARIHQEIAEQLIDDPAEDEPQALSA